MTKVYTLDTLYSLYFTMLKPRNTYRNKRFFILREVTKIRKVVYGNGQAEYTWKICSSLKECVSWLKT